MVHAADDRPKPRQSPVPRASLEDRLRRIARQLVERVGVQAVSLRSVTEKARCSPMAAYRHFASKDVLMLEVAAEGFEELKAGADQAVLGKSSNLERLEHVLLFYFDFAASNPHLFELMFSAIRSRREESERFMRSSMAAFQRLGEYTEHCIGDGIFVREPYPGSHVLSLWATIHGLSVLANSGHLAARIPPGVSQTTFARTLLRPCLDGLRRNKP